MTASLVATVAITAFSYLPPLSLPPPLPFFPSSSSPPFPSDECTQFLIDIGVELIILYEHIYEIYGDIQGARNSFDIDAYEQGQQG